MTFDLTLCKLQAEPTTCQATSYSFYIELWALVDDVRLQSATLGLTMTCQPTAVVQLLRHCIDKSKDMGSISATVGAFLMEAKGKNTHVSRFWCMLKIPGWSK